MTAKVTTPSVRQVFRQAVRDVFWAARHTPATLSGPMTVDLEVTWNAVEMQVEKDGFVLFPSKKKTTESTMSIRLATRITVDQRPPRPGELTDEEATS